MASKILDTNDNHSYRVRGAEISARMADHTKGDFMAFQAALTPLEKRLEDIWSMLNPRFTFNRSFGARFIEQRERCEVTCHRLDGMVIQYGRFLTLV